MLEYEESRLVEDEAASKELSGSVVHLVEDMDLLQKDKSGSSLNSREELEANAAILSRDRQ